MNMLERVVVAVTIAATVFGSTGARACPSDFDNEFGDGGVSVVDLGPDVYGHDGTPVVLENGDILTAGSVYLGGNLWHPALRRHHSDGSLDTTFGNGGIAELDVNGYFAALAVDDDGRIVAGGDTGNGEPPYRSFLIARFDTTGAPDPDFGDQGFTVTPIGTHPSNGRGLALLSDGRSVLVGQSIPSSNEIAWAPTVACYDTNGQLDTEFGQGGIATVDFGPGSAIATAVLRVEEDSILVSGLVGVVGDTIVAKLDKHGNPVAGFGSNGVSTIPGADHQEAWAMDRDAAGRIYVASDFTTRTFPHRSTILVHRLFANGAIDPSYGHSGKAMVKFLRRFATRGIAVDADGVASLPLFHGAARRSAVIRFSADGRRDRTFGTRGVRRFHFDEGTLLWSAVLQDDHKLLIGGRSADNRPLLLRLEGGAWDGEEQCVIGCGNGIIGAGEQCDDANALNGDGCSAACLLE